MKKYWSRFLLFIKKPENVFISLSLFFGVLSAATVPLLSVNDEGVHYMRAYGLSQGKIESGVACTLPKEVVLKAKEAGLTINILFVIFFFIRPSIIFFYSVIFFTKKINI